MQDLGTLGGTNSYAKAINANGWVVGDSQTTGDAGWHSFLWDGHSMIDLNTALPVGSPFYFGQTTLIDINDAGQIVANALNPYTHTWRVLVLSPRSPLRLLCARR